MRAIAVFITATVYSKTVIENIVRKPACRGAYRVRKTIKCMEGGVKVYLRSQRGPTLIISPHWFKRNSDTSSSSNRD